MTFAPAKFEIATTNSLGEDAFTRKYIIWPWPSGHTKCCPVPSKSCDLCTYRVWSYFTKSFRRRSIYKKIQYLIFGCYPVPSTSCDLSSYKVWSCFVKPFRRRYIYKKIHYLIFDLDLVVKVTPNVAQYPLHHVTYSATKFEVATLKGLGEAFTRKFNIWPLTFPSTLYIIIAPDKAVYCVFTQFRGP